MNNHHEVQPMARLRSRFSSFFLVLLLALFALPAVGFAWDDDDMVFDEEEVDDMTFAPADAARAQAAPAGAPNIAAVAIPSADLDGANRVAVQSELRKAMDRVPNVVVYGDSSVLPALEDRDPASCSREPLCLAAVGRTAGVDRIVQARVTRAGSGYRLDLDHFDVQERLFIKYHSASNLSNMDAVLKAIQPGVNDLFNIRAPRGPDPFVDDRQIDMKRIMAYTTAGLSVASLGAGVFFGTRVNAGKDEFESFARNPDGSYTNLTQRQAQERIREIEANALTANVFFGLSAGLAVTSGLLFFIKGDDGEERASLETPWHKRIELSPTVSAGGAGVGARMSF
jgi:hypothetical protein